MLCCLSSSNSVKSMAMLLLNAQLIASVFWLSGELDLCFFSSLCPTLFSIFVFWKRFSTFSFTAWPNLSFPQFLLQVVDFGGRTCTFLTFFCKFSIPEVANTFSISAVASCSSALFIWKFSNVSCVVYFHSCPFSGKCQCLLVNLDDVIEFFHRLHHQKCWDFLVQ